ncbi:MAG: hypothetical protein ACO2PN_11690 [Pyrobaculum sp.]
MSMMYSASYKAYDATLDKLVAISIDKVRREICVSKDGGWSFGKECYPYPHGALTTFEMLLKERRVPYIIRSPEFAALHYYTVVVWEPAGVKLVEVYYDNRGFLRDAKGRVVEAARFDVAARFKTAPADVYMCLGHVAEKADSVKIECIAPPWEAAQAMWALERAKLCVAERQDLDVLRDVIRRYEAEMNACRAELEELKKVRR